MITQNNSQLFFDATNGRLGVGNNAPGFMLHVGSSAVVSGTSVARFENAGGTCTITPNTAGGITCTSDQNLKKDIAVWDKSATEILSNIDIREYRMLTDTDTSTKQVGFIAQNVEELLPWLVRTDETSGYKAVSYAGFTPVIVQAIKEINAKLSGAYNAVTFWVKEVKAERITTDTLCLKDVCITKDELQKMLRNSNTPAVVSVPTPIILASSTTQIPQTETSTTSLIEVPATSLIPEVVPQVEAPVTVPTTQTPAPEVTQ